MGLRSGLVASSQKAWRVAREKLYNAGMRACGSEWRTWRNHCLVALACLCGNFAQAAEEPLYQDTLMNGWEDWGWAAINYNNAAPVHGGSKSIAVTMGTGYPGIFWHRSAFGSSVYTNLVFWIHGGSRGGQKLQVNALINSSAQQTVPIEAPVANAWQKRTVSLAALGVGDTANLDGFWIQSTVATAQPVFYLDDVALEYASNGPVSETLIANITVDAEANRRPISPLIYGVAFASSNQLRELNAPLNRWGGNSTTRYNWWLNADNKANDWYYQSIGQSSSVPGAEADQFIQTSRGGGALPMLSIPMVDWMPKLGPGRSKLWSYSIAKYGTQTDRDWQWAPDAGNGVSTSNNTQIVWNDPNDANFLTNSSFQQAWVRHLTNRWGKATTGGLRYYILDNEYSLWHSTHRDIHPNGATMAEVRDKFIEYAGKVKEVDPDAKIVGFEEWGWSGYFYSGADQQWSAKNQNWNPANFPDRKTNGGMDYMPWMLKQLRDHETSTGRRLLDVFTTHVYPQSGEFTTNVTPSMQATRNRSTRQLWDPTYVDPSWINQTVMLIPRMRAWVNANYPGLPIGITEYNWGAEEHINGATAQADILGIFGREGLDLAARWTTPPSSSVTFKAMKLFRNYDGTNSTFGDLSVPTTSDLNPDQLSAFAAVRSDDNCLTIVVINKQAQKPAEARLNLAHWQTTANAQVWQLTSANVIARLADLPLFGATLTNTLPAQSITLFVIPGDLKPPSLSTPFVSATNTFGFRLAGLSGKRYEVVGSTNGISWTSVTTGTLTTTNDVVQVPLSGECQFYRARWLP